MQIIITINDEDDAAVETRGDATVRPSDTSAPAPGSDTDAINAGSVPAGLAERTTEVTATSSTGADRMAETVDSGLADMESTSERFDEEATIDIGPPPEHIQGNTAPPLDRLTTESRHLGLDAP